MKKISVDGERFVDTHGRHVILNGINLVHKGNKVDGKMNYIASWDDTVFKNFKEWGFNLIRLGVIWDGVEPNPGEYDEAYLDWIEKMLDLCKKHDIYAYLDMHQDLYSVLYSDGAPEWATITDGQPHVDGELWSDAYIFSEAVKRAFDNFWENTPASDGIGLQDHYVNMWVHIVKRFADHPAIIGYDFLNEPFPGSSGTEIFGTLMGALAETMNTVTGSQHSLEDMVGLFSDQEGKLKVLDLIENKDLHRSIAKVVEPLVEEFDKGALDSFYRKMTGAIRAVDKEGIIMRENSYFSNIGIQCKANPITNVNGEVDPMQAFSPHGYDLVVDTEAMQIASNNRVDVIFEAHRRTQKEMGVPVMVGEWGAHGNYPGGLYHIEHILELFDSYLWSNTYWCYTDEIHEAPALEVLKRPYPQAACGEILSYKYDRESKKFYMDWDEKGGNTSTVIYIPQKNLSVECEGKFSIEQGINSALLIVEPTGGKRSIIVSL